MSRSYLSMYFDCLQSNPEYETLLSKEKKAGNQTHFTILLRVFSKFVHVLYCICLENFSSAKGFTGKKQNRTDQDQTTGLCYKLTSSLYSVQVTLQVTSDRKVIIFSSGVDLLNVLYCSFIRHIDVCFGFHRFKGPFLLANDPLPP